MIKDDSCLVSSRTQNCYVGPRRPAVGFSRGCRFIISYHEGFVPFSVKNLRAWPTRHTVSMSLNIP